MIKCYWLLVNFYNSNYFFNELLFKKVTQDQKKTVFITVSLDAMPWIAKIKI